MSYAIYVGRNRTADGQAYLAGYGDEPSSHWLEIVPRETHPVGSTIEVGVTPEAEIPGVRSSIPQAAETARHLRVSYTHFLGVPPPLTNGGLNEHGVAVRDVWSPSHERLVAHTPPDQTGPNYADLARIVLERARTAREGVLLIGELIDRYGYSTYGGNSHLIADEREAWVVIEFAGGKRLWVAERLDDDAIRVSRPGYITRVPTDLEGHPDFLGSPNLVEVATDEGWYRPESDAFDVNAIYGDGRGRWPGVAWIEGELATRAASESKLTIDDLFWALRSPRLTGDTAGYGQVVPLGPVSDPDLRVLWHAPIGAIACPFTPFLLGVAAVPPELRRHRYLTAGESARFVDDSDRADPASTVPQRIEATRSAVAIYKRLLYLVAEHHEHFLPEVTPVWEAFERLQRDRLDELIAAASTLIEAGRAERARALMTRACADEAIRALDLAETMLDSMEARSRILFGIREDRAWHGPEQLW